MFSFPPPKLGTVSALTITSTDLEASLAFWQTLGFNEVYRADIPFPWIQISDGALLIMLRLMNHPYISLTYYVQDFDRVTTELEGAGIVFTSKQVLGEFVKRNMFVSPDGLNIALVSYVEGFNAPAGPTMLSMPPQDYRNPDKYVNKICGMYGEFSHGVKDLSASIAFWENLGFKMMSKFSAPYPWAIVSDGVSVVGLHQSSQEYPAITFFACDMKSKIEKLKSEGLTHFVERGGAGNIDVTTPEGQHVFLFGM